MAALEHMWLSSNSNSTSKSSTPSTGVVQRIQRFGNFNELKKSALEQV
jgi:hypothetical protein